MGNPDNTPIDALSPIATHLRQQTDPVTTEEIVDATDYAREEVLSKLNTLSETGEVASRELNGVQLWWTVPVSVPWPESSDNLLKTFFHSSPTGIGIVDRELSIITANDRLEQILGETRDQFVGENLRERWNVHHGDGREITADECPITRALETGDPVFGFEHWLELSDGQEKWMLTNVTPIINEDGLNRYVLVCAEDLTDAKNREDKLTSEDSRYLKLTSEQIIRPFLAAADGQPQIDIEEVVPTHDGGTHLHYVTIEGLPVKAAKQVFEGYESVTKVRLVKRVDDQCRLEVSADSLTLPVLFAQHGGQIHALVDTQDPDSPCIIGELPGDVDYKEVIQDARQIYSDIELESQELAYSPQLLYDIVADDLTDKQFAILQAAYYSGYFENPRKTDGNELSDRFDISRQALNKHLRKAQQTVIKHLFESTGDAAR